MARARARYNLIVGQASLELESDSHSHSREGKDGSFVKIDSPLSPDEHTCSSDNGSGRSDGGSSLALVDTLVEIIRSIPGRIECMLPILIRVQPVSEGPDDEDQSDFTYQSLQQGV